MTVDHTPIELFDGNQAHAKHAVAEPVEPSDDGTMLVGLSDGEDDDGESSRSLISSPLSNAATESREQRATTLNHTTLNHMQRKAFAEQQPPPATLGPAPVTARLPQEPSATPEAKRPAGQETTADEPNEMNRLLTNLDHLTNLRWVTLYRSLAAGRRAHRGKVAR